jgi:signal transduction histidine kinase
MFGFRRLNLRGKLILILLSMALLTLLVATSLFSYNDLSIFKKNLVRHNMTIADSAGSMTRAALLFEDSKRGNEIFESLLRREKQIEFAALYDEDGALFIKYSRKPSSRFKPPSLKSQVYDFVDGHFEIFQNIFLKGKSIGKIYLYANMDEFNAQIENYIYLVSFILLITLAISLALSIPLQSIISKPIIALAAMEKRISQKGDYSIRGYHDSSDEIGLLYKQFNEMLSQIEVRDKDLVEFKQHLENSCNQLRHLNNRMQSIREEESSRISREVHDELGQMLTALKMDLTSLKNMFPEGSNDLEVKLEGILAFVDQTIDTVRKIATDLRPEVLDHLGLSEALEWYAEDFQERIGKEWKLEFNVQEVSLQPDLAMALFRIYQETLTNVARHANASKIQVKLQKIKDSLSLEIIDNGKGIATSEMSNPQSLGLMGMRERARVWGGEVLILSQSGFGTSIQVNIPLEDSFMDAKEKMNVYQVK